MLWQRSLEDALVLAKSEGRPLFIAVNMDGESASERIVKENYRDPEFVALSRRFVCVIASAFRHEQRDHDDLGRRIPCPRLGEVTCGEHMALEPILFEKYLGGERIAPRHALILPDGTKSFDLFLLFDLGDLDRRLAQSIGTAPPPSVVSAPPGSGSSWIELASARDHRGRLAFETRILTATTRQERSSVLKAIADVGDGGSVDALRVLVSSPPSPAGDTVLEIGSVASTLKIESQVAAMVRERVLGLGRWPGAPGLDEDGELLLLLGDLDGASSATRSLLLAQAMLGSVPDSSIAREALRRAGATDGPRIVETALETARTLDGLAEDPGSPPTSGARSSSTSNRTMGSVSTRGPALHAGGSIHAIDIAGWLAGLEASAPLASRNTRPTEELPQAEALEKELERIDDALGTRPDDPALLAEYGRTTLALARKRIESGRPGAQLLLQDADRFLERACRARPKDVSLFLARARASYLLGSFEKQESIALAALSVSQGDDRFEALRWLGDASARLLSARSGEGLEAEARGIALGARSLEEVAAGPEADETDWISLGSFLGALGLRREELAVYQVAAERLPASAALRASLNTALWAGGRIELAAPKAEWIAARNPDSADAAWHAGYARMLVAEEYRRSEAPDRAIDSYARAVTWFESSVRLKAEYLETSDHYRAMCAFGSGFAHLLANRREEAGQCLVEGLSIRPQAASARDGLDREAVDLLDGSLEWRTEGASPVDAMNLLNDLERVDPGNPLWPRSISDSELREALRADGRGEVVECDRYLRLSIEAGRRALSISRDSETLRALAQSLTISAEHFLERGDTDQARECLLEAAPFLGGESTPTPGDETALRALAGRLRERLGPARPRFRPGR